MKGILILTAIISLTLSSCAQTKTQKNNINSNEVETQSVYITDGTLPEVLNKENYNTLTEFETYVIEKKGTERSFTGAYHDNKKEGVYICKRCNLPLFASESKFDSGTGWPSFDDEYKEGVVKELTDGDGYRTEILCNNCDGHLGHVFRNEGMTKKQTRHCVNSASIRFVEGVQ